MRESIEAVVFKHRTERHFVTFYVEGPSDVAFFKECLKIGEIPGVAVHDISTVDLSNLNYENLQLEKNSNRDKVRRLIHEMRQIHRIDQPLGIIDGDFDHLDGVVQNLDGLFVTDYSCMEAYFWGRAAFRNFLNRSTKRQFVSFEKVIGDALNAIFSVRFVNRKYKIEMSGKWIDCFSFETGFDYRRYVKNIIIRAQKTKEISPNAFAKEVEVVLSKINSHHIAIQGHDMLNLLAFVINKFRDKPAISDPEILLQVLFSLDCFNEIREMPMIQEIFLRTMKQKA